MKTKSAAIILFFCLLLCAVFPHFSLAGSAEEIDMSQLVPYWDAAEFLAQELWNGVPDENGQINVDVSAFRVPVDDKNTLRDSSLYHFPQNFFWTGGFSFSHSSNGYLSSIKVTPSLGGTNLNAAQLAQKKEEFMGMLEALCALRCDEWSDLETVLFYNDYLAANYQYDLSFRIYNPFEFLSLKTGVCQAYTAVFQLLMNRFGIPCSCVHSNAMNHIWNIVYVDGAWYHLDVTHNDPTNKNVTSADLTSDRPGSARHTHFLTGSVTTADSRHKSGCSDMVFGAQVTISAADHPLYAMLESTKSPVASIDGVLYTILQNSSSANLVVLNANRQTCSYLKAMTMNWYISGSSSSYFTGNYSTLATDGSLLYYFDSSKVYSYDPQTGAEAEITSSPDGRTLYGLQYSDGTLTVYTGTSPTANAYEPFVVELGAPVYYTITWIIGDDVFTSQALEGSDPLSSFNGSTERDDEDGVSYIFDTWSPELAPVTGDATYTALYIERLLYTPGDIDGSGKVDIADVTLLLNYLSGVELQTPLYVLNVNGDVNGTVDIADVTELLNLLSQQQA